MHIIFGNYGDNTVALIQWAYEHKLADVYVVHVDTGWANQTWSQRVESGQQLVQRYSLQTVPLKTKSDFVAQVIDRGSFPSTKFQWCVSFLKALPLLGWLDEVDPSCEATILLGSRRADSRARVDLPEFIEQSEHYNQRRVWYPLYDCDDKQRSQLIAATGLELLNHRSLECDPCVNCGAYELAQLSNHEVNKTLALEQTITKPMFADTNINVLIDSARQKGTVSQDALEMFDMGCGSQYACGE